MDKLSVYMTEDETRLIQRTTNYVAKKYTTIFSGNQSLTKEELFHCGAQGLLEARKTYDSARKVPWLVFAAFRVKGAMLDHIRKLPLIKLSHGCYKKIKQVEDARIELYKSEGSATMSMIAKKLNWSADEVNASLNMAQLLKPTHKMTQEESDDSTVYHKSTSKLSASSEDNIMRKELIEQLQACLDNLSDSNRLILISRTLEDAKLRELAESFSCSAENIRLLQKKAAKQMRKCLQNNNWTIDQCLEVIQ